MDPEFSGSEVKFESVFKLCLGVKTKKRGWTDGLLDRAKTKLRLKVKVT